MESAGSINQSTMKNKIQLLIRKVVRYTLIAIILASLLIVAWEAVRPNVVTLLESEPVVIAREVDEPTEFELYVASKEVQDELNLMFKKQKRKELDDEIAKSEGLLK